MINWFIKRMEKREADELAKAQAEYDAHVESINYIKSENLANYTQSINNSRYIRSSINVLTSNVHSVKGRDGAETKRKKEFLRGRIKWLSSKLIEEESMVEYYGSLSS
jgi:hypothetical protein